MKAAEHMETRSFVLVMFFKFPNNLCNITVKGREGRIINPYH